MAQRTTVTVQQSETTYPIQIGSGLLGQLGSLLQPDFPQVKRILVVTDTTVEALYLPKVMNALSQAGYTVASHALLPGEASKTMDYLTALFNKALAMGLKRNDLVIALGGGITGDITGFFAATYLRGVAFIQVPTTLLAQVDASVGGKVAINWQHFKNIVGAFYHPHAVIIDTDTLTTLPQREFVCGMAEVVKYSLLQLSIPHFDLGSNLFERLQAYSGKNDAVLSNIILDCCRMKAAVVTADPEERRGIREILNLGHTFAHAYETLTEGHIAHGEAVSMGIINAFDLAVQLGQLDSALSDQVKALFKKFSLPIQTVHPLSVDAMLTVMQQDKKVTSSEGLRLILPYERLGLVRVQSSVDIDLIRSILPNV